MTFQITPRLSHKPSKFPNAIREYRLRIGLSQRGLGAVVGKSRKVISAWERGLTLPKLPSVFRLAKTLGTLAESLYHSLYSPQEGNEENQPKP